MTARARIVILVVAVLALIVAFALANGTDDTSDQADNPPAAARTTTVTTEVTVPAGEGETGSADTGGATQTQAQTTLAEPAAPAPPLVQVKGGKPVGGVKKLTFKSGERVRFAVRSDTADEIHVHGYDLERELPAGRTITMSFPGKLEGRFEVELHGSGTQIASLEVRP